MKTYSISFFGHRQISDALLIEKKLEKILCSLLDEKEYIEFLVGRDGEFDQVVSSVIHRYKRLIRQDNCALVWVLPYPKAELRDNEEAFREYYDEIEICSSSHFKSAYQNRNRQMVDRSDLVICCVEHNSGGAYQALRYAQKKGKEVINICGGFLQHEKV